MTFLEHAASRRSCRTYDPDRPVEPEKLERCLEAARLAPSASNGQPWRFVVVTDPVVRQGVARATFGALVSFNHFALQAPHLVVVVMEPTRTLTRLGGMIKRRRFELLDLGMASLQLCLQAAEEGLGTCMLGWFDERAVRRLLGIPRGRRIALIVTLGYPAPGWNPAPRPRKALDQVRSYDRYPVIG